MQTKVTNVVTELDHYITWNKNRLDIILKALDWSAKDSLEKSNYPTSKDESRAFDRNDPMLPESLGSENSVVLGNAQLRSILNNNNVFIPEKFSDIQLNFTKEEKVKLYEYVIENTTKSSEPELKVSLPHDDYAMTFAEIVAKEKKKEKKLRRKYRTSKPTHIEEVRNLVSLQMHALGKYLNPESENLNNSYEDRIIVNTERTRTRDSTLNEYCRRKSRSYRQKIRSRSTDRSNRSLERRSRSTERDRKQSYEKKIRHKEDIHEKTKKRRTRSKSPTSSSDEKKEYKSRKSKNNYTHHRR